MNTNPNPMSPTEGLLAALSRIMPIRVQDGRDYAEVFFSDGQKHSSQAMTMNPGDWQAIADAYAAIIAEQGQ